MVGIDREDMTLLLWRRSFDMKYLLFNSMDVDLYYGIQEYIKPTLFTIITNHIIDDHLEKMENLYE